MSSKIKALVLTGFGLNCEKETAKVLEKSGAVSDIMHVNDIIENKEKLNEYKILAFIGGFAFGDHISGGKVLSIKLKYKLQDEFLKFIDKDNLIFGVCNGFQTLVKLGVLPGFKGEFGQQTITLAGNVNPGYYDNWVRLKMNPDSPCVFTKGIDYIDVPVRHGEGQFIPLNDKIMDRLKANNQIAAQYVHPDTNELTMEFPFNPNGSVEAIAAICDETGRIFGIMPHPEAHMYPYNHPYWVHRKIDGTLPEKGDGMKIFENAVQYFK